MSERKYSFSEIECMRRALAWTYPPMQTYYPEERTREIEERLRTLLIAGVDPQEVIDEAHKTMEARQKMEERGQKTPTHEISY
jgi:hypothetical protein